MEVGKKRSIEPADAISDEEMEDFLGFADDGDELDDKRGHADRIHRSSGPVIKKMRPNEAASNKLAQQSEDEIVALYQNWDNVDKSQLEDVPAAYKTPFEFGWKRELVFRATANSTSKDRGEVYYITPKGKKLRTRAEIQHNLGASNGLTFENFSFAKIPLYMGPQFEIIRNAKLKTMITQSPREVSSTPLGKRVPKPKAPYIGSSPPSSPIPHQAKSGGGSHKSQMSSGNVELKPKGSKPCTIHCPQAMGRIPQLQCSKCLCLYHHECAGVNRTVASRNYVCEGCTVVKSKTNANHQASQLLSVSQTVVMINNRRFIVVPKTSSSHTPSTTDESKRISNKPPEKLFSDVVVPEPSRLPITTTTTISKSRKGGGSGFNSVSNPILRTQYYSDHANMLRNAAIGYDVLLKIFRFLKVKELLRASCVCRLFNQVAHHPSLWHTVRMKNSQVNDWTSAARTLRRNGTRNLDLRKMLVGPNAEASWRSFSAEIGALDQLESIELCRVASSVVEGLFTSNQRLRILNSPAIKDGEDGDTIDLTNVSNVAGLTELRLRSDSGTLVCKGAGLEALSSMKQLRHLSLTFFVELEAANCEALASLTELISLEIGECSKIATILSEKVLPKMTKLERLRMEKGTDDCDTMTLLQAISEMPKLKQLEMVNFDIKAKFNEHLAQCTNIKALLIIPTYISQSATTNNMILSGVMTLSDTLEMFTWVITTELLRVTELYVSSSEKATTKDQKAGDKESIPILKPVPGSEPEPEDVAKKPDEGQQVDIVSLTKVQQILRNFLPNTTINILKSNYNSTWRLHIDSEQQ